MIRIRSLVFLSVAAALPVAASAQFDEAPVFRPRVPRAWVVATAGIGPSGGGVAGTNGLSQLFRAATIISITQRYGIEAGVLRIQEVIPAVKVAGDRVQNDPRADGVYADFVSFNREPGVGVPALGGFGFAVMHRPNNDPSSTKLTRTTGALVGGVESQMLRTPFRFADISGGARVVLMPGGNHRELYLLAVTLGLRFH
ncbi:MAG TPA: hypothetical protein VIV65_03055 [Gemmatimonadaceae bacterium]|jgi:hypothetical protein